MTQRKGLMPAWGQPVVPPAAGKNRKDRLKPAILILSQGLKNSPSFRSWIPESCVQGWLAVILHIAESGTYKLDALPSMAWISASLPK